MSSIWIIDAKNFDVFDPKLMIKIVHFQFTIDFVISKKVFPIKDYTKSAFNVKCNLD